MGKEFQFGNAKVVVHSKLAEMTEQQQKAWYQEEWEQGNEHLKRVVRQVLVCCEGDMD